MPLYLLTSDFCCGTENLLKYFFISGSSTKKKRWRCALRPYYIIAMTGIIIFCGNWICSFWQILCRLMNMYEDVVKIYRRSSILFIFLRSYAALYVCFSCMKIFVLSGQIFLGVYVYTCIFFLVCTNVGTALMQINRLF